MNDMLFILPPFFFYAFAAFLLRWIRQGWQRTAVMLLAVLLGSPLTLLFFAKYTHISILNIEYILNTKGYIFYLIEPSSIGLIFASAFSLAAIFIILYSQHRQKILDQVMTLIYIGSAINAVLCGDFISFFLFLEVMTISSSFLILSRSNDQGYKSLQKSIISTLHYLYFHIGAGVVILVGISYLYQTNTSLALGSMPTYSIGGIFILIGLMVKSGVFPFHVWLEDAYTSSTSTNMVPLSIFTTKTSIFGLVVFFHQSSLLLILACITVIWPLIFTLFDRRIRHVLIYLLNSQIGFMTLGASLITTSSFFAPGPGQKIVAAYAFMHIVYDTTVFMAGALVVRAFNVNYFDRLPPRLWKRAPIAAVAMGIGLACMGGLPLTGGFFTKSLLLHFIETSSTHSFVYSALIYILIVVATCIIFASSLRIMINIFFRSSSGYNRFHTPVLLSLSKRQLRRQAIQDIFVKLSLILSATTCILFGVWPSLIHVILPKNLMKNEHFTSIIEGYFYSECVILILAIFVYYITRNLWKRRKISIITQMSFYTWYKFCIEYILVIALSVLLFLSEGAKNSVYRMQGVLRKIEAPRWRFFILEWQSARASISIVILFLMLFLLIVAYNIS